MATQFDFLLSQVRTAIDGALINGTLTFYEAGTTTLKPVYLDQFKTTQSANPYTLDANSTSQLYGAGNYLIVIKNTNGTIRYSRDNITASGEDGSMIVQDASTHPTYTLPDGGSVIVCKSDASATAVVISPGVAGQTINGLATYSLTVQGETVNFSLSNSTWYIT
jgi:hypothetical protein